MPRQLRVRKKIPVYRTCAKCGHQWSFVHEYSGSSDDSFIRKDEEIYAEIEQGLNARAKAEQNKPTTSIVCPRCSSLAREFIKAYFPEGFVEGLKNLHAKRFKESLGQVIGMIIFTLLFVLMAVWGKSMVFILASIGSGGGTLWFIIGAYMVHSSRENVFNWLGTLSEDQAGAVVGEICQKKNHFPSEIEWELTSYYNKKIKKQVF